MNGHFITFEGPEGAGKTMVVRTIYRQMRDAGYDVLLTREPGGTEIGNQVREVLLAPRNTEMTAEAEFLLFSASRAQLVREVIQPALARGTTVLCDRFYDSSLAYQGYGRSLDLPALRTITTFATGGLSPDLTILLDIDPRIGLKRRRSAQEDGAEWNRLDADEVAFHDRVRAGYRALVEAEPARWHVIDAAAAPADVIADAWDAVRNLLNYST